MNKQVVFSQHSIGRALHILSYAMTAKSFPEDTWKNITSGTDLNMSSGGGKRYASLYQVIDGQTNTNLSLVLFEADVFCEDHLEYRHNGWEKVCNLCGELLVMGTNDFMYKDHIKNG
jgi:hypothetical protein